jgi:hypothetical protein
MQKLYNIWNFLGNRMQHLETHIIINIAFKRNTHHIISNDDNQNSLWNIWYQHHTDTVDHTRRRNCITKPAYPVL